MARDASHTQHMVWAKVALVSGVLVVLAAFAVGTEVSRTATVDDHVQSCGSAISPSWLVPGTPDLSTTPAAAGSPDERAMAAACAPVIRESRTWVLTAMGFGALLALGGFSAVRQPAQKPWGPPVATFRTS